MRGRHPPLRDIVRRFRCVNGKRRAFSNLFLPKFIQETNRDFFLVRSPGLLIHYDSSAGGRTYGLQRSCQQEQVGRQPFSLRSTVFLKSVCWLSICSERISRPILFCYKGRSGPWARNIAGRLGRDIDSTPHNIPDKNFAYKLPQADWIHW